MNKNHYVAIMAGGIGSRFWPMSRTHYPKQFLDILNTGRTLIQATYDRFLKFIPAEHIYVVTSEQYKEIVEKQLPELPAANIVCEPSRKNTAPCIAYIAHKLQGINANANLICAPADHLVMDEEGFKKVCLDAFLKYVVKIVSQIHIVLKRLFQIRIPHRFIQNIRIVSDGLQLIKRRGLG